MGMSGCTLSVAVTAPADRCTISMSFIIKSDYMYAGTRLSNYKGPVKEIFTFVRASSCLAPLFRSRFAAFKIPEDRAMYEYFGHHKDQIN
jgi:hypothetical protein